jgi:hypothetical protein
MHSRYAGWVFFGKFSLLCSRRSSAHQTSLSKDDYEKKWAYRYATLSTIALTCSTASSGSVYDGVLTQLWDEFIARSLEDSRECVRYVALVCCAELATTLADTFYTLYPSLIPKLTSTVRHTDVQVRGLAANAIVNICSSSATSDLLPYTAALATTFEELLHKEKDPKVLQSLLDGLGALADVSRASFEPYVDNFIILLDEIVQKQVKEYKKTKSEFALMLRDTALFTWSAMVPADRAQRDPKIKAAVERLAKYVYECTFCIISNVLAPC